MHTRLDNNDDGVKFSLMLPFMVTLIGDFTAERAEAS